MQIYASAPGQIEKVSLENLPVRDDHRGVGIQLSYFLDSGGSGRSLGLHDIHSKFERDCFYGRGDEFHAAALGSIRLGDDGEYLVASLHKTPECGNREFRRAKE